MAPSAKKIPNACSKLTKKNQHQLSHHGCLAASNGLPANYFLYLLSETVRNVVLTKFVCCVDSDLLYISKLRPYISTWHCIANH